MKDTVMRNVEQGVGLSGSDVGHAERKGTELYYRVRTFMEGYDFFATPVSQVPPVDVKRL
jgi:amidase